jgi:hypothetical protein
MLPAISLHLALCAAVNVWGTHRILQHFVPKGLIKWFRNGVGLMFKALQSFR